MISIWDNVCNENQTGANMSCEGNEYLRQMYYEEALDEGFSEEEAADIANDMILNGWH